MKTIGSLALVLLLALACSSEGTVKDVSGADTPAADTAGGDDSLADAVDAEWDGSFPDWSNLEIFDTCSGPGTPGALPVGAVCTSHNECVTGYCYDEDWKNIPANGGFRFCTIGCSACLTSCSEWDSLTSTDATCILFLAGESNDHDLRYRSICMPTCQTAADCEQASAGALTVCRPATHYDGTTIGLKKSCFPM